MREKLSSQKFQIYLDGEKYWECLENGKDIDTLYPDHFKEEITGKQYEEFMKDKLLPNEEYVLFDGIAYDYAITSFGRIFNCAYGTQVKIYFAKDDATVIVRTYKDKLSNIFAKNNWVFDYNALKSNYKKYKWGTRKT